MFNSKFKIRRWHFRVKVSFFGKLDQDPANWCWINRQKMVSNIEPLIGDIQCEGNLMRDSCSCCLGGRIKRKLRRWKLLKYQYIHSFLLNYFQTLLERSKIWKIKENEKLWLLGCKLAIRRTVTAAQRRVLAKSWKAIWNELQNDPLLGIENPRLLSYCFRKVV